MKRSVILMALIAMYGAVNAQQIRTYTDNDEDSLACITAASLYIEFVKQENYKDAKSGWKEAVTICPKFSESLWSNGAKMYQSYIDETEDKELKNKLIDTLEWIYDQRILHFGNEGYVRGRKGVDMAKYRSSKPKEAHEELKKSYELITVEMEPAALIYYFKTAYDMYRKKLVDQDYVLGLYGPASAVVKHNKDGKYGSAYLTAQKNIDNYMGKVVPDCATLVEIFKPKFEQNKADEGLLDQITKLMDKNDCGDEDLYLQVAVAKYEINPNAEAAFSIGKAYYKRKDFSKANEYFKQVMEGTEDQDMLFDSYQYYAVGSINLGQPQTAKTYAQKMLAINPNSGEAYIIIGNAYVKGKSDCGGDACKSRAVYWAAVDKFYKAKSVDPEVASKAQQLINSYSAQFPKKEDCFFYGLTDGQSYTIDCWIGETTKVRTVD
ncbi:MAG: hypothetical protein Salg2KO_05610 [Salibacteraceae bacterium]